MNPVPTRLSGLLRRGSAPLRSARAAATAAAALVALAGLVLLAFGAAHATVWAPESVTVARVAGQPGVPVVVTTEGSTRLDGPSLRVDVRGPADQQVFVGVGRADDVAAYLAGASRAEVTGARDGQGVVRRAGNEGSLPEPTGVDIWALTGTGRGSATLTWPQLPGRWRVVAAVDGATPPSDVVLTWQRARASSPAPTLFAVGGLLLVLGLVGAGAARRALPAAVPATVPARVDAGSRLGPPPTGRATAPVTTPAVTPAPVSSAPVSPAPGAAGQPAPSSRRGARATAASAHGRPGGTPGASPFWPPPAAGRPGADAGADPAADDEPADEPRPAPFRQPPSGGAS